MVKTKVLEILFFLYINEQDKSGGVLYIYWEAWRHEVS